MGMDMGIYIYIAINWVIMGIYIYIVIASV